MKYVMAFGPRQRRPALLEGVTRAGVAAECRAAALEFMSGVADGWEKEDLARWLTGPYAHATRHCQHGERTVFDGGSEPVAVTVDPQRIDELLTTTRARMLAALEKAALSNGAVELARDGIELGLVRRAVDEEGVEVWVPVDAARMRLIDRVRALFVADCLDDPVAYRSLYVCHRCEAVVYDEEARELGMCSAHHRVSGVVYRSPEDIARALGETAG